MCIAFLIHANSWAADRNRLETAFAQSPQQSAKQASRQDEVAETAAVGAPDRNGEESHASVDPRASIGFICPPTRPAPVVRVAYSYGLPTTVTLTTNATSACFLLLVVMTAASDL